MVCGRYFSKLNHKTAQVGKIVLIINHTLLQTGIRCDIIRVFMSEHKVSSDSSHGRHNALLPDKKRNQWWNYGDARAVWTLR